ncbi:MAG: hypothetical protein KJ941_08680, partial [Bacteroidetes bacterium]|nr:hypothetical protein [Bacteroidota bacterium]
FKMNELKKNPTVKSKLTKTFQILLIGLVLVVFSACKKKGCTDASAKNYNSKAKKEDQSCEYTSTIIFWYSQATRDVLEISYPLRVRVGGKQAGLIYSGNAFSAEPIDCIQIDGTVQFVQTLYDRKISVVVSVVDNTGLEVIPPTNIAVNAGGCLKYKI